MPDFSQVQNYSDINFENTSIEDMLAAAVKAYEGAYFSLTGKQITLQPGDDAYILIYAQAARDYAVLQSINFAARQNFLKYASGTYLDNLAANTANVRDAPKAAVVTLQFTLSKLQSTATIIPKGTRASPGSNIYFATDAEAEIPAGSLSAATSATCLKTGTAGNGYIAGQINSLVDPVPYIASVTNTEASAGGSDAETDLSLAEKIFSGPEGFSVAGPSGAYDYFTRQFSQSIADTYISSPNPGEVNIRVLLSGGTLPNQAFLDELSDYLNDRERRPLTDQLTVAAPDVQDFDISLTYYLDAADKNNVTSIQNAVSSAVADYVSWQQGKIGRDIIPDHLTAGLIQAGAKRVVITSPVFTQISATSVGIVNANNVVYGGIDDA